MSLLLSNFATPNREKNVERLLDDTQIERFLGMIDEAKKIVICAHVNPDGDAIGSSLALKHWLARRGKEAQVVVPNMFPDFLQWMPGAQDIRVYFKHEEEVRPVLEVADLFLVADMNEPGRLREMETDFMANDVPRIMIDHHLNPGDFCQMVISHPEMCATCEVLCHLLWQMGEAERLTPEEATCLYAGMMCDTGAFTYASGRAVIYECISMLLSRGIDKDRIYRKVFYTASLARLRLQGYLLYVKLRVIRDRHTSIMTLTNVERQRFKVKNGDTEGMVNMPLVIHKMRLSIFLTEDTEQPGLIKVSLRSVDNFPCNKMAAEFFEGGGHLNASGGRVHGTMEDALQVVDRAIEAYAKWLAY